MSISPRRVRSTISRTSWSERKREITSMRTGNPASRSRKVRRCCSESTVVGTSTATWYPSCTALNAARTAISVFPKPTSPQMMRSIGCPDSMSPFTAVSASTWSGVSSYGNASSISCCHAVSGPKACPWSIWRAA